MKFCNRRTHSYKGFNGIETQTHYVTINDVEDFHGKLFFDKWLELIKHKPVLKENWFYYEDYKFAARQADSFFNPIS